MGNTISNIRATSQFDLVVLLICSVMTYSFCTANPIVCIVTASILFYVTGYIILYRRLKSERDANQLQVTSDDYKALMKQSLPFAALGFTYAIMRVAAAKLKFLPGPIQLPLRLIQTPIAILVVFVLSVTLLFVSSE